MKIDICAIREVGYNFQFPKAVIEKEPEAKDYCGVSHLDSSLLIWK